MSRKNNKTIPETSLIRAIGHRFSLLSDKAEDEEIQRRIREGVELEGATPWILIFAIFIASIGLNVNSTAVIIGAMLISPIMGPILGMGLGVAIYDYNLVKRSFLNLIISTIISLTVSFIYFSLTPLQEAQSELLGRIYPTLWDVLIAFFGGAAGIVGVTRKEKSNVIPGVAIATALMPPICTAGYGIATGNLLYFAGAFYLYTINCVFIAISTFIGIRILKIKSLQYESQKAYKKVRYTVWILALCTALPSMYSATNLVKDEVYNTQARNFINREFNRQGTHIAEMKIDASNKKIEVALIGKPLQKELLEEINTRLASNSLSGTSITVHQTTEDKVDVTALKSSLITDLYQDTQLALRKREQEVTELKKQISDRSVIINNAADIFEELKAQNPYVTSIFIGQGVEILSDHGKDKKELIQLSIKTNKQISAETQKQIKNWFSIRTKNKNIRVIFEKNTTGMGKSKKSEQMLLPKQK